MENKTACSKSWTDVNIDFKKRKIGHCCVSKYNKFPEQYTIDFFDNNEFIQQRRQDTLSGIQHPDCSTCWHNINNGNASFKKWWNKWKKFDDIKADVPQVNYVEIDLDNTCDLSCLYCAAETSSKIAQEEGVVVQDNTRDYDIEMFKLWFKKLVENTKSRISLNFSGGEPTASKYFYDILDFIQTLDTTKISIDVITNGNSKPHLFDKFIKAIDSIDCRWTITISNESYGSDSELIRYGLDWNRFEQNVIAYAQHPKVKHINVGITINNLALPTLHEYISWVYNTLAETKTNFTFCGNFVSGPDEMDVSILPDQYKIYVDKAIQVCKELDKGSRSLDTKEFLDFLNDLKDRIGTEYKEDYLEIIEQFLHEKQRVKKTNRLMNLLEEFKNND